MRKPSIARFLSIILTGMLFYSCTSWNTSLGRRAKHQYQVDKGNIQIPQRKSQGDWWQEYEVFQIMAESDTILYTAGGATLYYYGGSLLNSKNEIVNGRIHLKIQEAYTAQGMIFYNAPTISNGRLLESGGEINLRMFKGNEELSLDPAGVGMKVQLRTVVQPGMELFYADRDRNQNINWVKDTLLTPLNFTPADDPDRITYNGSTNTVVVIDSANGDWSEGMWYTDIKAETYLFNTKKLGWINCDRFYNDSTEKTNLMVRLKTPLPEGYTTRAYLVFEGINAVLPVYSFDNLSFSAENVPVGSKVKLVVLGEMEKLFYLEIQEIEISKGQIVWSSLSPCNKETMCARLTEL